MTDREMVELAAKAAGAIDHASVQTGWDGFLCLRDLWDESDEYEDWNPLLDDGDALRLAVILGITVEDPHQYNTACATITTKCSYCGGDYKESWAEITPDAYSGTRRAIVRAAAEIGKQMP